MSELLDFASSRKYVSQTFRKKNDDVKWIRNWIAHNKDLTNKIVDTEEGVLQESPLYRIDDLKNFVTKINNFFNSFEELEQLVNSKYC
jgi:hypothetical protein